MAETKVIDLEVKTNLTSLKAQLREAQAEVTRMAEKFGDTSVQAANAAKAAAILKDKIGDAKALTDAFNPDAKFNAVTSSLSGVASGFGAVQGAMGLMGVQGEEVQKTLLKVQSAMAISQGLQQVGAARDSFKQLGAVIKSTSIFQGLYNFVMTGSFAITTATTTAQVAETAATVAQGAAITATATATTGATVAMKLFRLALIATGIGAIIVGIGFLIANMGSLLSLFSDSAEANARNAAAVKANTVEIEKNVKANDKRSASLKISNDYQYAMAKATGATNEQLREMALRHAQSTIEMEKNSVAIATQVYWKNKLKLQQLINAEADEEDIKNQRKNAEDAHKALAKEQKDYHDALDEKKAVIRQNNIDIAAENYEANKKEIEDTKSHHTTKNKIVKDSGKDRKNAEDKEAKDRQDAAIKANKELLKLVEDLGTDILTAQQKAIKDRQDAAIKAEEDIYKNARGFAEASTIDNQNDFQAKQDLLDIERAILLQNKELTAGEIAAIDAKYRKESADLDKEELDRKQALNAQKMNMAIDAFSILQDATTLFTAKNDKDARRQFQINKALSLSSAIVNTALGITGALTAGGNPIKLATGMQFVEAGIVAAAGGVSIAKIAGTQYGGFGGGGGGGSGGSGGGGGGGGATPASPQSAPNFNLVGATGLNQLDMLGKPIQAFVVGGEVTTYQELERNRLRNATL
jgi:hypothetical protein